MTPLLHSLTEPHPSITQPEARHRARLTGTLLVMLIPLGLIGNTVITLIDYILYGEFDPVLIGLEYAVLLGILLCYLLSRTRHVAYSARLLAGILFVGVFASIVQSPQYKTSSIILPLPLLVGGLILSPRASRLLFFGTLAGTLLLPALGVNWEGGDYVVILAVEIIFGISIMLSSGIREQYSRQVEGHRRDLEERATYAEERAREISEALVALAALEFDKPAQTHGTNDIFDALAMGVNMLAEELQARIAALRSSEERLRYLIEASPAVIYTASLEGDLPATYYSENVLQQTGFTPDQFIGNPRFWIEHLHPDDRESVLAQMGAFFENGEGVFEYRFRFADGEYHWMRDSARLACSEDGKPREMVGSWMDITGRRQLEEQLRLARDAAEAASRAKSEFLSAASHDLRTPLNAILGFSQLLEMDAASLPERAGRNVREIAAGGRKLLAMVDQILDFARSETGRLALDLQPVDVSSLLRDILPLMNAAASEKRLTLTCDLPSDPCLVRADSRRLMQILRALIMNAIKFTPEGGTVIVECKLISDFGLRIRIPQSEIANPQSNPPQSPILQVIVKDTGIGMSAAQLECLFQPLTQADTSPSRPHSGLGLELALAKRIVELHDGRLRAESEGEGKGSAFILELPT